MQKRDKRNKIAKENPESFTKVILNRIDYFEGISTFGSCC